MNSIEEAVKRLMSGSSAKDKAVDGSSSAVPHNEFGGKDAQGSSDKLVCKINTIKLKKLGFLTPASVDGVEAEQYRVLKRPLLVNAFNESPDKVERSNSIMITSSLEGEGKTFTAVNLAISMAMERDYTVLLIDSDVIKASLSKLFGLQEKMGLVDLLTNPELELSDVIVSTDIPRLKILPAGRPNVHSTELMASEQMKQIASELSKRYSNRVILYDAPPLLATSQARVLLNLAGQILLVVEAGKTPKDLVQESAAQLDENKVIGIVLNKSRIANKGYYGGYYGSSG